MWKNIETRSKSLLPRTFCCCHFIYVIHINKKELYLKLKHSFSLCSNKLFMPLIFFVVTNYESVSTVLDVLCIATDLKEIVFFLNVANTL